MNFRETIEFLDRQGRRIGRPLQMTNGDFRLLGYILSIRGKIMSHRRLISLIRGSFTFWSAADIEARLELLRQKIEVDPRHPEFIV